MTLDNLKTILEAAINWNDRINARGYIDPELESAIEVAKEVLTQHSINI